MKLFCGSKEPHDCKKMAAFLSNENIVLTITSDEHRTNWIWNQLVAFSVFGKIDDQFFGIQCTPCESHWRVLHFQYLCRTNSFGYNFCLWWVSILECTFVLFQRVLALIRQWRFNNIVEVWEQLHFWLYHASLPVVFTINVLFSVSQQIAEWWSYCTWMSFYEEWYVHAKIWNVLQTVNIKWFGINEAEWHTTCKVSMNKWVNTWHWDANMKHSSMKPHGNARIPESVVCDFLSCKSWQGPLHLTLRLWKTVKAFLYHITRCIVMLRLVILDIPWGRNRRILGRSKNSFTPDGAQRLPGGEERNLKIYGWSPEQAHIDVVQKIGLLCK